MLRRSSSHARGLVLAGLFALAADPSTAHAASTSVEAESMSHPRGSTVLSNAAASGARELVLNATGAATKRVPVPAHTARILVRAAGRLCRGAPRMAVTVDGSRLLVTDVESTSLAPYAAAVNIPAGTHQLRVAYLDDHKGSNCNRNLVLDRLTMQEAAPVQQAESHALARSHADRRRRVSDASASGGKYLALYRDDTAFSKAVTPAARASSSVRVASNATGRRR